MEGLDNVQRLKKRARWQLDASVNFASKIWSPTARQASLIKESYSTITTSFKSFPPFEFQLHPPSLANIPPLGQHGSNSLAKDIRCLLIITNRAFFLPSDIASNFLSSDVNKEVKASKGEMMMIRRRAEYEIRRITLHYQHQLQHRTNSRCIIASTLSS